MPSSPSAGAARRAAAALAVLVLAGSAAAQAPPGQAGAGGAHGLSIYGDLKYGPGFRHFEYVNPEAPRGGEVRLAAQGTFDTLHPFILRGVAAAGLGNVFDTLMAAALDEPSSEYGLVAESVEIPPDRSWVAFTLRPEARFHDGRPVTVEDVVWTFTTLKQHGHPQYRAYYAAVERAEAAGPRTVRFRFVPGQGENRELPLIVGQLPVLSKAYWSGRDFTRTTLEAPLGSGPYRVESAEPGRSIVYRRVADYWGARLPVNVGRHNVDVIRIDYYRDAGVLLEAFKAGAFDFREENSAKAWATGYDGPARRRGLIRQDRIPHEIPTGMQAWVFNTRRPLFADRRVRWALAHAFDFEWSNAHLFYGAYTRTTSYFANSELASRGLPGPDERAVLEPFRGRVPEEVFTTAYRPPSTDGAGYPRDNLRRALDLLGEAGWVVRDLRLVHAATGVPFRFEILLRHGDGWERIALPFVANLRRLGIEARVRNVDPAQYQYRTDHFDFDVVVDVWGQSMSPGNEQRDFWSSAAARTPGSRNTAGISDPAVDELIARLIAAPDRPALVARTRALDRVLLWGHYVIPNWHISAFRVASWDLFGRPAVSPKFSLGFDTWWIDPAKAEAVRRAQRAGR